MAETQGDRFGLVTFSDRTHKFVRARKGMDHFRLCREAIYNLQASRVSPDFPRGFHCPRKPICAAARCWFSLLRSTMLCWPRRSSARSRFWRAATLVLVNAPQPPGLKPLFTDASSADLQSLYNGLAGQMISNRLRQLALMLSNRGVRPTVVDPRGGSKPR